MFASTGSVTAAGGSPRSVREGGKSIAFLTSSRHARDSVFLPSRGAGLTDGRGRSNRGIFTPVHRGSPPSPSLPSEDRRSVRGGGGGGSRVGSSHLRRSRAEVREPRARSSSRLISPAFLATLGRFRGPRSSARITTIKTSSGVPIPNMRSPRAIPRANRGFSQTPSGWIFAARPFRDPIRSCRRSRRSCPCRHRCAMRWLLADAD